MSDLFIQATRQSFRYPSTRGELTTEQLWSLPLIGKNGNTGFDLDSVARSLHASIKAMGEASFVETKADPRKTEAEAKLEVVKFIIATKQDEAKLAEKRVERAQERKKLLDALAVREAKDLSEASREDILKKLAALDD